MFVVVLASGPNLRKTAAGVYGSPPSRGRRLVIPVTSFAGKTVAVFGLGGSGLASAHALKAGGAEVIAADDSADNLAKAGARGAGGAEGTAADDSADNGGGAAQAGFITGVWRRVSWANFAALVLT